MIGLDHRAVSAARRAYLQALEAGAKERTAFDVACAAYRVSYPAMQASVLQRAVATGIAMSRKDPTEFERGDAA
jgi:hypothetical protein